MKYGMMKHLQTAKGRGIFGRPLKKQLYTCSAYAVTLLHHELKFQNDLTNGIMCFPPCFCFQWEGDGKDRVDTAPLPPIRRLWLIVIENSISSPLPERQSDSGA